MTDWNKVVTNMGRGMDPLTAYNRAERDARDEHRRRMKRLQDTYRTGDGRGERD